MQRRTALAERPILVEDTRLFGYDGRLGQVGTFCTATAPEAGYVK
jgi:hypothetical protein